MSSVSTANENIQARVSGIFEKLNSIHSSVQDEKNNRFQLISQLIMSFEANLQQTSEMKEEKFSFLSAKIKQLGEFLDSEGELRERNESDILKLITDLERHAKRLLEANSKERIENEKKVAYNLGQQIDLLSQEVTKEGVAQSSSHQYIDAFLNEDLPKISDELQNEITERKEVEEKVFHQFVEQINDLKEMFDREKKEREIKEEEIVETLRDISSRIQENVKKTRREREKTEESMVQLVEQVIEKLKKEMIEMNI